MFVEAIAMLGTIKVLSVSMGSCKKDVTPVR